MQNERPVPAPLEDATAISPGRAIPPAEIHAICERYKHVDPMEAMIPVLQEMQVKFGYITQDAAQQMAEELGLKAAEVTARPLYSFFVTTACRHSSVVLRYRCYVRGAAEARSHENRLNSAPRDQARRSLVL